MSGLQRLKAVADALHRSGLIAGRNYQDRENRIWRLTEFLVANNIGPIT